MKLWLLAEVRPVQDGGLGVRQGKAEQGGSGPGEDGIGKAGLYRDWHLQFSRHRSE